MSLADFDGHLRGQRVQIIYHGGCPDGCLAALILRHAIADGYKPSSLELIPTSHAGRNADKVVEGSTAIFADVSPTVDDELQLQKCRCIIILDHHASATAAQETLKDALPQLKNFSDASGTECGATIARRFCHSRLFLDNLVHLFHKMDVFQHQLPASVIEQYDSFKGFITQHGLGRCTIDLVEELLANTESSLASGLKLFRKAAEDTSKVFSRRSLMSETQHLSVWATEFGGEGCESIDLEFLQSLIDQLPRSSIPLTSVGAKPPSKALVFATVSRSRLSSGLWTVGLRRGAGDTLDMGVVAQRLGECSELQFKTGGGHPYAAGASCADFELSAERLCEELVRICTGILQQTSNVVLDLEVEDTGALSPLPKRRRLESSEAMSVKWQSLCGCHSTF